MRFFDTLVRSTAVTQWAGATRQQKALVRFGMIPKELHDRARELVGDFPDFHRLHAAALMECAKRDGGMVV